MLARRCVCVGAHSFVCPLCFSLSLSLSPSPPPPRLSLSLSLSLSLPLSCMCVRHKGATYTHTHVCTCVTEFDRPARMRPRSRSRARLRPCAYARTRETGINPGLLVVCAPPAVQIQNPTHTTQLILTHPLFTLSRLHLAALTLSVSCVFSTDSSERYL